MTAFDSLQQRLARARSARLSSWLVALLASALVLPWIAYAWMTLTERADQIDRTERNLAAFASAYAEHAAAI